MDSYDTLTIASKSTQRTVFQKEVIKSSNNIARQAIKAIECSNDKVNNLLSYLNEVEIQSNIEVQK